MHPEPENNANKHKAARWLTDAIFYLAILFFIIGFNFSDRMAGNWYQQFMPTGLPNFQVADITFLDSLTGFAVTGNGSPNDSSGYILKTTDGGNNWSLKFAEFRDFSRVKFINANTGFVSGGYFNGARIYKTTNAGENWFPNGIPGGGQIYFNDIQVISEDSIWVVADNSLVGGVFRTTNGGASWQQQLNLGSLNPDRIYMINGRKGFVSQTNNYTRITTNSGQNWNVLTTGSGEGFYDMYFADTLTGYGSFFNLRKTTNGGLNWIVQTLPFGGNILISQIDMFAGLNRDTIWGVGGSIIANGFRGIIYRTTNGGDNWLFQVPDTAMHIGRYLFINFVNSRNGWAYNIATGIHTTTGGDPMWVTGITQISTQVPKDYKLSQNYPNPFNPRTVIPFSLKQAAYVRIIAYDITGREVQKLVDSKLHAGEYEVDFMGKFSASGVYFYRMEVTDERSKQLYTEVKKMILLK